VKLQTAATIDLGLVSPDDAAPLEFFRRVRHCDVRYAVFYGTIVEREVRLVHLVMARGADFFSFFQRFEGKVSTRRSRFRYSVTSLVKPKAFQTSASSSCSSL